MKKMANNLMIINKMIIFLENLISDDIDHKVFEGKITFDFSFINTSLDDFWIEYLNNYDMYKDDNFVKTYTFLLKRFGKLLAAILKDNKVNKRLNIENNFLKDLYENNKNKLEVVSDHNTRLKLIKNNEQCINEEEYMLLLDNIAAE